MLRDVGFMLLLKGTVLLVGLPCIGRIRARVEAMIHTGHAPRLDGLFQLALQRSLLPLELRQPCLGLGAAFLGPLAGLLQGTSLFLHRL